MKYETVIGLEVHAELSTQSKIYCSCKNEFGGEPNTRCCPVCTGMPGALPVLNERAVEYAVRMGCALHCEIRSVSEMARKNYFYPDLPKAYQISQFDHPLCENGWLEIETDSGRKRIGIIRLHMEEDAGKLIHSCADTQIDFNRCGVPLIEIVTAPDLRSPEEAGVFLETVRSYLSYLDISDCRMEEGSIRCDVNVSLRPEGSALLGIRCEMKNINSFSGVMRAIAYESDRQEAILQSGGVISRETRRWDDLRGMSFPMRVKEGEQDYRYFPEPDLPPVRLTQEYIRHIRRSLPELPDVKQRRYRESYGLTVDESAQLTATREKSVLFEAILACGDISPRLVCRWVLGEFSRRLNRDSAFSVSPANLYELLALVESSSLNHTQAKQVLDEMDASGKSAAFIVGKKGIFLVSDEKTLAEAVRRALTKNEKPLADYRAGKTNALGYLVGQCIRETGGQGDPAQMKKILLRILSEE